MSTETNPSCEIALRNSDRVLCANDVVAIRLDFYSRLGKRCIDLILSFIGLLVLSPVLIVLSGLVKFTSPGPVLFKQQRVGKNGRLFWILKFRSMVDGAERMGAGITPVNDLRITQIGAFLRKWKLDEIPQLWNVLRGDMSLVGPRPELPQYVAKYTTEQRQVLKVRPGITDPASLRYRDEGVLLQKSSDPNQLYLQEILPDKLKLNLAYLRRVSFSYDIKLVVATIRSLLRN